MIQGIVKWFDVKKGYGFLVSPEAVDSDGSPQDVFIHYSKIQMEGFKKVEVGDTVTFTLVKDSSGRPQAEDVALLSPIENTEN